MKRYFPSYPLEERKALWDKYLPIIQERFTDDDYAAAQESFAEVFPDYESMTEYEGVPFDPNDRSQVALANMFGWDDSHWDDWYDKGDAMKDTIPTIKSMLKKSDEPDMKEEYDSSDDVPTDEKAEARERQRTRLGDKVTDADGNSRLVHRANVADLRNFDQDINAPQGNVYDADKLKAPKMRKSTDFRELISRKTFEKTGRIADVEFMDSYQFQKAPTYVPDSDAAKVAFHEELSPENLDKKKYPIASEVAEAARRYMANEALYHGADQEHGKDISTAHLKEISPYPPFERAIMNTVTVDGEVHPANPLFTRYGDMDLLFNHLTPSEEVKGKNAVDELSRISARGGKEYARENLKDIDRPVPIGTLFALLKEHPYEASEEWNNYLNTLKEKYKNE